TEHVELQHDLGVRHRIGDGDAAAADLAVAVPLVDRAPAFWRAAVGALHVRILLERRPGGMGVQGVEVRGDFFRRRLGVGRAVDAEAVGFARGNGQHDADGEGNDDDNDGSGKHASLLRCSRLKSDQRVTVASKIEAIPSLPTLSIKASACDRTIGTSGAAALAVIPSMTTLSARASATILQWVRRSAAISEWVMGPSRGVDVPQGRMGERDSDRDEDFFWHQICAGLASGCACRAARPAPWPTFDRYALVIDFRNVVKNKIHVAA